MKRDPLFKIQRTTVVLAIAAGFLCLGMVTLHFVKVSSKIAVENETLKREMELVARRLETLDYSLERIQEYSGDLDELTRNDLKILEERTGVKADSLGELSSGVTLTSSTSKGQMLLSSSLMGNEMGRESNDADEQGFDLARESAPVRSSWSDDEMLPHPLEKINELMVNANLVAHRMRGLTDQVGTRKEIINAIPSLVPTDGRITSGFGVRISPFTGKEALHRGIDIAAPKGTVVQAPADGKVLYAGWSKSFGRVLVIGHGLGIITKYAHNSRLLVKRGDTIKRGQPIARVGSTGRSTGSHLHYEVWVNGRAVNPGRFLLDGFDSIIAHNAGRDDLVASARGGMGGEMELDFSASNRPVKREAPKNTWERPINLAILALYCMLSGIILSFLRGRTRGTREVQAA